MRQAPRAEEGWRGPGEVSNLGDIHGDLRLTLQRLRSDWDAALADWSDVKAEEFGAGFIGPLEVQGVRTTASMDRALQTVAGLRRRYELQ